MFFGEHQYLAFEFLQARLGVRWLPECLVDTGCRLAPVLLEAAQSSYPFILYIYSLLYCCAVIASFRLACHSSV